MNLLTEIDSQTQKANLRLAKWEGQINQEFGINIHTVLYIYKKTNKDLLYSTGNYIKYLVITYSRKELEKECTCAGVLSSFSRVQLFATLWTVAHQVPLSMGFSRQESWSGLPSPPPRNLSNPGIKLTSLMPPALAGWFFTICTTWEVQKRIHTHICIYVYIYTHTHTHTHTHTYIYIHTLIEREVQYITESL